MTNVVLLPTARFIPVEMRADFGDIPSAMIPLGGRPALRYIAAAYNGFDCKLALASWQGIETITTYLENNASIMAEILNVGETANLGETVHVGLQMLNDPVDTLVINFADTLIEQIDLNRDAIYFAVETNTHRWTSFSLSAEAQFSSINDKHIGKENFEPSSVFCGVFVIKQPERFKACLAAAIEEKSVDLDPFYGALVAYFNDLPQNAKRFVEVDEWLDFGHLDTYYKTKRKLFKSERAFNSITVDNERGVLRKSSTNTKKFEDEVRWYLNLPPYLQHQSPRVFDYKFGDDAPFVEMEFYGYPVLSDVYLYGAWDLGVWNELFERIANTMARMRRFKIDEDDSQLLVNACKDMYETKTISRLAMVSDQENLSVFNSKKLKINKRHCVNLPTARERLPELINALGLYENLEFSIIHGDLCLSNILYDPRNQIIRLIDPRGSFGSILMYGDPRYDVAKLHHSFVGDYDFYVNGLFSIDVDSNDVTLQPRLQHRQQEIKRLFMDRFIANRPEDIQVTFIQSLLFLSMVALHKDRPRAQMAFVARGLLLLQDVLDWME